MHSNLHWLFPKPDERLHGRRTGSTNTPCSMPLPKSLVSWKAGHFPIQAVPKDSGTPNHEAAAQQQMQHQRSRPLSITQIAAHRHSCLQSRCHLTQQRRSPGRRAAARRTRAAPCSRPPRAARRAAHRALHRPSLRAGLRRACRSRHGRASASWRPASRCGFTTLCLQACTASKQEKPPCPGDSGLGQAFQCDSVMRCQQAYTARNYRYATSRLSTSPGRALQRNSIARCLQAQTLSLSRLVVLPGGQGICPADMRCVWPQDSRARYCPVRNCPATCRA